MNAKIIAILPVLSVVMVPTWANVLNVANNGVDSSTCGTTDPCRSITQAITNANSGDSIIVGPGLYGDLNGDGVFNSPGEEVSGDPIRMININKPLTIYSRDGAGATILSAGAAESAIVWIDSDNVTFGIVGNGFTLTNSKKTGVTVEGRSNVTIQGNVAHSINGSGFAVFNSSQVTFLGNTASDNTANGFFSDNGCSGLVYTKNVASRNFDEAGFAVSGTGHTLTQNVASNNLYGFVIFGTGFNFRNNVANSNLLRGFEVRGSGHTIKLNEIVGNDSGIGIPGATTPVGTITQNNIYGSTSGCGLNLDSNIKMSAKNNFWGAATGPGRYPADNVCITQQGGSVTSTPFASSEYDINIRTGR